MTRIEIGYGSKSEGVLTLDGQGGVTVEAHNPEERNRLELLAQGIREDGAKALHELARYQHRYHQKLGGWARWLEGTPPIPMRDLRYVQGSGHDLDEDEEGEANAPPPA